MKGKTVKLQQEDTVEYLYDLGFLKQDRGINIDCETMGKLYYIKIKIFGGSLGFKVGKGHGD